MLILFVFIRSSGPDVAIWWKVTLNYQIIFHNENELQKYVRTKGSSYKILIKYELTPINCVQW